MLSRSLSRSLRQGGACHCTSASELNHLCGILGGGWGQGPARNHVMSDPEREPSVLCHGWPGPPHPSIPIPSPPAPPSPAPPTVSPACASPLGVSLELQVADSWFKSRPPCCFSALLESRVNLALCLFHHCGVCFFGGGVGVGVTFLSQPTTFTQLASVHKQLLTVSSMSALAHLI